MSKVGKLAAISLIVSGVSLMTSSVISGKREKKEKETNAKISSVIDRTELELKIGNIKCIKNIDAVKNNGELFIVIDGEFNHRVNGGYDWSVTYKVDNIDYKNIKNLTDLNEKMFYVSNNIYSYYDPIDVSYSETELVLI